MQAKGVNTVFFFPLFLFLMNDSQILEWHFISVNHLSKINMKISHIIALLLIYCIFYSLDFSRNWIFFHLILKSAYLKSLGRSFSFPGCFNKFPALGVFQAVLLLILSIIAILG